MAEDKYHRYAKRGKSLKLGECDEFVDEDEGKKIRVCKTKDQEVEIEEAPIGEEDEEPEDEE